MRNARFLTDPRPAAEALLHDLRNGLRYFQGEPGQVLPWDITYSAFAALPCVHHRPHDRFGWPVYYFDRPLLLGSLEISGLQVNVPNERQLPEWRFDVPLHTLPFEVRLVGDGVDNYWQLKSYFGTALGEPISGWERDDQLHTEWNSDGLLIHITYWLKSYLSKGESGFASLHINNERIFPQYFIDEYLQAFTLDARDLTCQTFAMPYCTVPYFYRTSHWVRFTPEAVRALLRTTTHDLVVWHDSKFGKLGFAKDEPFCKVVEVAEDQQFVLQFIDHDRGQYSHEIQVLGPGQRRETVLAGQVGALEAVVQLLEQVGIQVVRRND